MFLCSCGCSCGCCIIIEGINARALSKTLTVGFGARGDFRPGDNGGDNGDDGTFELIFVMVLLQSLPFFA